jgi:hypothetical protein
VLTAALLLPLGLASNAFSAPAAVSPTAAGVSTAGSDAEASLASDADAGRDACDLGRARATRVRTGPPGTVRLTRAIDHEEYTPAEVLRIDRALNGALASRSLGAAQLAKTAGPVRIPVHVHVINNRRSHGPGRRVVRRQVRVMNAAYSGKTSSVGVDTRFRFYLKSLHYVRNARWYDAVLFDAADRRMRRKLHRGNANALNLYISKPRDLAPGATTLGWSSVPWRARKAPRLDGVTINKGSLPGGRIRGYNRGDTMVHEVGHWLGLFHTFENGCDQRNDLVDDTPAEAFPATTCEVGRDTCDSAGHDPVRNFMNYPPDACMNRFTRGQANRMHRSWTAYRAR